VNQTKVAKIISVHGLKGSLVIYSLSERFDWLKKKLNLSISIQNSNKYYEVLDFRVQGKKAVIKLNEISDRTQAESYIGKDVFIDSKLLVSKKDETIYLSEILSFKVIDKVYGDIGLVKSFSSNGSQDLICVDYKKGDLEIPFVPEIVLNIDFEEKTVFLELPEQYIETFYP